MPFPMLAEHIAARDDIYASCALPCGHGAKLDLDALAGKFGFCFRVSAYSINHRLRCKVCGRKQGKITLGTPKRRHPYFYDIGGKPVGQ